MNNITTSEKIINFVGLWVARLVLSTLALAGALSLLSDLTSWIAYGFSIVLVAFLLKETL